MITLVTLLNMNIISYVIEIIKTMANNNRYPLKLLIHINKYHSPVHVSECFDVLDGMVTILAIFLNKGH